MNPKQQYFSLKAEALIKALGKRNIEGFYCENRQEALKKAIELIPKGASVTWGGSQTLVEAGIIDAVSAGDYEVYDRAKASTPEEVGAIYRKAFSCDYYLAGANAVTNDGELVNIDGNGNRVAAMIYGPKNVLLVMGMQKCVKDVDAAIKRIRNTASIMNVLRLDKKTPCRTAAECCDCLSDDCICCQIVVTRMSKEKGRVKVILVGEELGY